jgi:hypothetical protein
MGNVPLEARCFMKGLFERSVSAAILTGSGFCIGGGEVNGEVEWRETSCGSQNLRLSIKR